MVKLSKPVLQVKLDEEKYLASLAANEDLSGKMSYCKKCKYCVNEGCQIDHAYRVEILACATAHYKRK